ncbi:MAG: CDP-glycerol glycerophosphotransferase family protein [Canibacter sp.]
MKVFLFKLLKNSLRVKEYGFSALFSIIKNKITNKIGDLSVVRERHNQIDRVKQTAISESISVSKQGENLLISQVFTRVFPNALVAIEDGQVVSRFRVRTDELAANKYRAVSVLPKDEIETAYTRALAQNRTKENIQRHEVDKVEPSSFSLQLAWIFEPSAQSAVEGTKTAFLSDDWVIPAARIEAALNLSKQDAASGLESIVWAGGSRVTNRDPQSWVQCSFGTAELRGNRFNRFVLALSADESLRVASFADAITVEANVIRVKGRLTEVSGNVEEALFVWRSNAANIEFSAPLSLQYDDRWSRADAGRRTWVFEAKVELESSRWHELLTSDYFDAYIRAKSAVSGQSIDQRLSRVPFLARFFHTNSKVEIGSARLSIVPYFTFKAKALSARVEHYPQYAKNYFDLSKLAVERIRKRHRDDPPVWLIGELPYKAQDNGMHFYNWVRKYHPEIDSYYVIDSDSPERSNLEDTAHVVDFGGEQHFELALRAEKFIGSHSPDYLYPTRNPQFLKHLRGGRIFLQHGVMAAKWTVPLYGKKAPGFSTDLFLVSSEYEKSYIVSDYGYDPEEVKVTGLSRFDTLLPGTNALLGQKTVLIMPTWRDWLQGVSDFTETEYFRRWSGLLASDGFKQCLEKNDLKVTLCLHPNMQRFSDLFEGLRATIVYQGEVDVQTLLLNATCMITDYSSVAMDFSFIERPVIFYQFDRKRFYRGGGTHVDLDAELPGTMCFTESDVLVALNELSKVFFRQSSEMKRRSERFIDHKDTNNNQRVFEAVTGISGGQKHYVRPGVAEAAGVFYRWFRRSSLYYPSMKSLYKLGSIMPRIKGLTVFESHHGKQASDSPRYIYEELVKQKPEAQKVWMLNNERSRFPDPNTKVVKRLSPAYFWTLSRAETWVLNQSTPHYLKRPKKCNYIQTWHGTPLKRMQHDAELSVGREEGYLARALQATSQWSVLLSPSEYATTAFRSAFRFRGKILETGYPRNDVLVSIGREEKARSIRRQLSISEHHNVVLYAPTFRDDQYLSNGKFSFDIPFDLRKFVENSPKDTILLLRLHSQVAQQLEIPSDLQDRVRDASAYNEIQELLLISDLVITDYSSVLFDAALLNRPIVLYAYDLDHYQNTLRGFYLNYEDLALGPIVSDESSLLDAVTQSLSKSIDLEQREKFNARFNPHDDGHVAERIVKQLIL